MLKGSLAEGWLQSDTRQVEGPGTVAERALILAPLALTIKAEPMTPFEAYVHPARAVGGWWRMLAGIATIGAFWIAGVVIVLLAYVLLTVPVPTERAVNATLEQLQLGGAPEQITVLVLSFAGIWAGVFLALSIFHRQAFSTIFSPRPAPRAGGFIPGMILALMFVGPSLIAAMLVADPVRTDLAIDVWITWFLILAPLIFIQAVGEELIFRGYLQQQLAARIASPLVWAGLPALLFGVAHFSPDLPDGGGYYYIAITFLMGLTMAALVWRSGSLWTAAGLHYGVNVVGLTVIGAEGILSGTQLWLFAKEDMARLFQVDLAASVVMLAFVLSPMGRIFGDGRRAVADDTFD